MIFGDYIHFFQNHLFSTHNIKLQKPMMERMTHFLMLVVSHLAKVAEKKIWTLCLDYLLLYTS